MNDILFKVPTPFMVENKNPKRGEGGGVCVLDTLPNLPKISGLTLQQQKPTKWNNPFAP